MDKIKQWTNYIIIGIVSFIALVFLPMVGSAATVGILLPTTFAGWCVWVTTKVIVAAVNIMIFHCFITQGKDTAKDTEDYKKAQELMKRINPQARRVLISPEEWTSREYKNKGVWIFITSALSIFALSQAVLAYDWITMLTYLFVIIFGIIFGILEQRKSFEQWSTGYLEYAMWLLEENAETQVIEEHIETPQEEVKTINPEPEPSAEFIILEEF